MQKTLSLHYILMWPCSPHLKHVGPFLLSEEFGELLWGLLRPVGLVVRPCRFVCMAVFVSLLYLHGSLRPVAPVVLVAN